MTIVRPAELTLALPHKPLLPVIAIHTTRVRFIIILSPLSSSSMLGWVLIDQAGFLKSHMSPPDHLLPNSDREFQEKVFLRIDVER